MAAVPRSKRRFGKMEEGDLPERKQCRYMPGCISSSPCRSFLTNGITLSPVGYLPTSGFCDDSYDDDSLLDFSDGEGPDSPTGLSREDEDKLLSDSSVDDLEMPSSAFQLGLSLQRVESSQSFVPLQVRQPPKALEGGLSAEPQPAGPSLCEENFGHLGGGSALSKEDSRAGMGLGSNTPASVRGAERFLNLQKDSDVSKGREKGTAQIVKEKRGQAERPAKEQASRSKLELGTGNRASSALQSTEGGSRSSSSQWEAAPSTSSSASGQGTGHTENPPAIEPKRPRRIYIEEKDLEASKKKYISAVLDHANGRPVISEVNELHTLIKWVASEYQEYNRQHTTDLTVRNYVRRSDRTNQRFSLDEWVEKNSRHFCRFANIPDCFQRSPLPS
ncbi:hypothetical protein JRQ81_011996 [Phrynocephalus forsythii]|uniref:S100P-binding protein n=1 Tax=Phrynocephalus forsythii TaxID=171643 RepID=A0A9Q1AQZ9_9SAUR|nr:hypothetical protein JRQ81_011996 [Phrynocephalus forsythii]